MHPIRAVLIALIALAAAGPLLLPVSAAAPAAAESKDPEAGGEKGPDSAMAALMAMDRNLTYRSGEIKIGKGLATLRLPDGYRYLDPAQTETVLTSFWGNPPGNETQGMIFAPGQEPLGEGSWAVLVRYEEDGYVKDDDAGKIDYDDLLKDMQKATEASNKKRKEAGYAPMHLVGWAEKPHYDKEAHKLHWAKELRVDGGASHSLNYDIRILGRRGVLVLTAVASMRELAEVKAGMPAVLQAVEFDPGHRYSEFDPKIDKVATYGIAGLVAGGLLAKVGFFKLLLGAILAAKKFLILGVLAVVAFFKRFFKGPAAQKEIAEVTRALPEEEKRPE